MASRETANDLENPKSQSQLITRFDESAEGDPINTENNRSGTMRTVGSTVINTPLANSQMSDGTGRKRKHPRRHLSYWKALMTPPKPVGAAPTALQSFRAIVLASWLNVLLVFIPVSWALHFSKAGDTVIFATAFLAIIPLAKLLGFATEEVSLRVGETLGGLLNATLGNAVELIVSIIALIQCQIRVVQASLVGSILSNLLLVLGMCFFAGGTRFATQGFLVGAAQLNSSLLTLSVVALLIPATFHAALSSGTSTVEGGTITNDQEGQDILKMSRGVAVIMLFIYGCNLTYQLWSHAHLYSKEATEAATPSVRYPKSVHLWHPLEKKHPLADGAAGLTAEGNQDSSPAASNRLEVPNAVDGGVPEHHSDEDEEEEETPQISVPAAIILLITVTVLVAFTAEFLVDSINGLVETTPLSQEWVGLILLPIVGNAAEHVTAVTVSVKDKLDLSIGVAVGSSIQIALLVIPFIIVLGWIIGRPITLLFDPFEAVVLFLTVVTVNYVVADGQSNWLEGMILMCLYIIIGTTLWFYPGSDPAGELLKCVR